MSQNNKKLIYTAYVRPILTYAAPVWCSMATTHINKIQRIQKKFLRLVTWSKYDTPIIRLHLLANIDDIQTFVNKISNKFYKNQLKGNPLLLEINDKIDNYIRNNTKFKHKPPYYNYIKDKNT